MTHEDTIKSLKKSNAALKGDNRQLRNTLRTTKLSQAKWKTKATSYCADSRKLRKRIQELENSRSLLRVKFQKTKTSVTAKSVRSTNRIGASIFVDQPPERYYYPTTLILFCVRMLAYSGTSLRSTQKALKELFFVLGLEVARIPSHSTIRMWVNKVGIHRHENKPIIKAPIIIVVDESIVFGNQSVIQVLGLPIDTWSFTRPATLSDVSVLSFNVGYSWKYEGISEIIMELQKQYDVKYVVGDQGNNLVKSYLSTSLKHIPDCTHAIAKSLEKYCKNNLEANEVLSSIGTLRQKWSVGKNVIYRPPAQRKIARYQNLREIQPWCKMILRIRNKLPEKVQDQTEFLIKNKTVLDEFLLLLELTDCVLIPLKRDGYSEDIHKKILNSITKKTKNLKRKSKYMDTFIEQVKTYLELLSTYVSPERTKIFCCSDIIESSFGKLKYRIPKNSNFGVTEYIVAQAYADNNVNREMIITALEEKTELNIKEWKIDNLIASVGSVKKKFKK